MHNLPLSQQEETFSQGDPWWTCAGPWLRFNQLLNSDVLSVRLSLEGSERRAAFRPPPDVIDNAILQTLNQIQFPSVQELTKSMYISRATIWQSLTGRLEFVVKHLHWVPHSLTDAQWQIRINRSNELLRLLQSAQANDWQSYITLDESWFYLWTSQKKFEFKRFSNCNSVNSVESHSRYIKSDFCQLGWTAETNCLERRSLLSITQTMAYLVLSYSRHRPWC
jgi:hypothetical protein